jgi:hypothetical protein
MAETEQQYRRKTNQASIDSKADFKVMSNDIAYMRQDVLDIKMSLNNSYVTKDQFDPIKKLVYGLVGLILTAVVVALMSLVINSKNVTPSTITQQTSQPNPVVK